MKKRLFNNSRFLVIAAAVACLTLALHLFVPFIYTVNDDLFMKNIVSGAYLGAPDAHTVYLEYPLSLMLSGLYCVMPDLPWYGIVFYSFHVISWAAIAGRCLGGSSGRTGKGWGAAAFLLTLFLSAGFYHIAGMQFTTTAAILGAAALAWFLTADDTLPLRAFCRDQLVTAVLVWLSFNVRRNVLLMLVPIAGMLWLGKLILTRGSQAAKYLLTAGLCLSGVAVTYGSYLLAYGSGEWKNYIRFNDNATVLYDYYGWADYEDNSALYEQLGISYESYYGAKTAYLLSMDNGIDADAMEALAERSGQMYRQENPAGSRLYRAFGASLDRMSAETDRPLNLIVLLLALLALGGSLAGRRTGGLILLAFLFIGRMFAWLYVTYAGRYPVRITQSLLLSECVVLTVLFLREALPGYIEWAAGARFRRMLVMLCGMGGLLLLTVLGGVRVRHVYYENTGRIRESEDLQEVKDYCAAHPEYFYFVDTASITKDTEEIFDARQSVYENYIVFGGWLSKSPVYQEKLMAAGAADVEEALLDGRALVITEEGEGRSLDYLTSYFKSKYKGAVLFPVDWFGRDGRQFAVYRLAAG